jgi:hypothetical protein
MEPSRVRLSGEFVADVFVFSLLVSGQLLITDPGIIKIIVVVSVYERLLTLRRKQRKVVLTALLLPLDVFAELFVGHLVWRVWLG